MKDEVAWFVSSNPAEMVRLITENPDDQRIACCNSDRKLRLFACACCRLHWEQLLTDAAMVDAVEMAERFADGLADADMLAIANRKADWHVDDSTIYEDMCVFASSFGSSGGIRNHLRPLLAISRRVGNHTGAQAALLRDIVGNPWQPVRTLTVSPSCLEAWKRAVRICQDAYDSRDFSTLPIAADALEDAGCDQVQVLQHLRGEYVNQVHTRGCWAVDLVLGKE